MPITRTQQKILDKEIDFNRKDENNNKVTIIKKWGKPDRYLDQYITNSEQWENLNKYNLLYVLQNKASRQKHVFKIGISTGNFRLKNYMDYNGGITDTPTRLAIGTPDEYASCSGIYLWYLAGQKNKLNSAKLKTTKDNQEIVDSYRTRLTWNKQRETFLKQKSTEKNFEKIQGYEWFIVPTKRLEEFRDIIVDLTNQVLKPDEKVRKQPARGIDKWIGQTFTDDGEMFEITGTSIEKDRKVVDYIDEKGEEYYANIEEVKEWLEQPARSVKKRGKGFVNSINIMEPKNKQETKDRKKEIELIKKRNFVSGFDSPALLTQLVQSYPLIYNKNIKKKIFELVKNNKLIVATELAYHLKLFIDDIFVYYGSNLDALMLIIQGIESIVRQIAPTNHIKPSDRYDDMKNLLRFFKSKNKKIVYGLREQYIREYDE
jgi:hypothetical protein